MPAQYEAIRDRLIRQGVPMAEAKRRAAKIYNSQHPNNPVGPNYEKRRKTTARTTRPGLDDV